MTELEQARARAFFDCRTQVKTAQRYEQRLAELRMRTVKSPRMDGLPHGSATGAGLDRIMIAVESLERQAKLERQQAMRAQKRAERYLGGMKLPQALFCRAYYIDGLNDEEAALIADRTIRQCQRYKREIFGSEGMFALREQAELEDE